MNKKIITVGMLSVCLTLTMPVATWANNIEETVTTAQFEEALPYVTDMITKYTQANVNIRKEPNINSEIYGQTLLNTTVDVILEIDGWSMIYAEDCENNHAFIKS
ncbi:SH3 domain-containing protein, partial [Clostridium sp. HBUAS56010]|uniref:SH3 domain-containing protein n=1 Tax=Clostridium sp. HBUAS56010 TaxID=2571127 RepID=UPI0011774EDC